MSLRERCAVETPRGRCRYDAADGTAYCTTHLESETRYQRCGDPDCGEWVDLEAPEYWKAVHDESFWHDDCKVPYAEADARAALDQRAAAVAKLAETTGRVIREPETVPTSELLTVRAAPGDRVGELTFYGPISGEVTTTDPVTAARITLDYPEVTVRVPGAEVSTVLTPDEIEELVLSLRDPGTDGVALDFDIETGRGPRFASCELDVRALCGVPQPGADDDAGGDA